MNYLDVAISAANEAGKIHLKYFQTDIQIETKTTPFDLVTIADTESEQIIVGAIRKYFPEHNFLAEENNYEKTNSEFTWIIDPLDGTNNFASGLPIFCTSIALAKKDELILGVIYDATRDELFWAEKDKGSFLNGKPIRVTSQESLQDSILITGFYYDRGEYMERTLDNIRNFFTKRIRGLRRLGAAALDLCYIASGRASGFWEFRLSPWDFAAGKLLVEEAGGKVTNQKGEEVNPNNPSYIVASNAKIHQAMLSVLR
ncbi:MAG: inositol monophosphatase [Omnitrophica bacterium]|nr:inositol monophosphatase [Candidatus Omnitrophota bacterium]